MQSASSIRPVPVQALAMHSKVWPQNSVLRIQFMGGTAYERGLVVRVLMEDFAPHVNLRFEVVAAGGHVRVAFMPGQGSWSMVGRDALAVPQDQPTLNLGCLDDEPGDSRQGCCLAVVKHELGHALGPWVHEHTHPMHPIRWNKPVVRRHLSGAPNFWNDEQINLNMFQRYDMDEFRGLQYDADSIMHYVFPLEWAIDGPASLSEPNLYLVARRRARASHHLPTTRSRSASRAQQPAAARHVVVKIWNSKFYLA
jgi:hypothetical protein